MSKELFIGKISDLPSIIASIKDNFQKETPENIIIRFEDTISIDDLLETLNLLWGFENESGHTIDILIKNLSYEHRKEALRLALKNEDLKNPIFLTNVFCLIKGYNTFSDSYFEHEQVFLNDEVEFLDIFDDLDVEIKAVSEKTAEYYVSMLKTCNLIEAAQNNPNAVKIESLYEYLFSAMDVLILARILSSVKNTAIWETKKIVIGALNYLGMVAEKFVFTNNILNLINTTTTQ